MSPSTWRVEFARRAERDLRRLDPPVRQRVLVAIASLGESHRHPASKPLAGRSEWRLRVGDWRVIFERDPKAEAVRIIRILPRGRAYER